MKAGWKWIRKVVLVQRASKVRKNLLPKSKPRTRLKQGIFCSKCPGLFKKKIETRDRSPFHRINETAVRPQSRHFWDILFNRKEQSAVLDTSWLYGLTSVDIKSTKFFKYIHNLIPYTHTSATFYSHSGI